MSIDSAKVRPPMLGDIGYRSNSVRSLTQVEREEIERERTKVRDGLLRLMQTGDVRYLIPESWHHQWKKYVGIGGHSRGDPSFYPGPMNLASLVDENGQLRRGLIEMKDFRSVPEDSWLILLERYGITKDSPANIQRNVILTRDKNNFNVEAIDLYPIEVSIRPRWELNRLVRVKFSSLDNIKNVLASVNKTFQLPEKSEARLWLVNGPTKTLDLLPESTKIQDLALRETPNLILEMRANSSEHWPAALDFHSVESLTMNISRLSKGSKDVNNTKDFQ